MKKIWLLIFIFYFLPQISLAQNQSLDFSGLAISPFLIERELEPGSSLKEKIVLTNTSAQAISYDISINDFVPDEKTGQAKFLPTGENADAKYSLSSWIAVTGQPNFALKPSETTEITFEINPPKDAELGSHYGGILFTPKFRTNSKNGPVVVEKVGAIIIVNLGKAKQQGTISNFYRDGEKIFLEFHNFGNVHLKPKGEIFIYNIFGKKVGNLYINRDADIVLPETRREFFDIWKPGFFSFGWFNADAVIFYGNPKLELPARTSFWVAPVKSFMVAFGFLAIFAYLGYKGIQKYNYWLVKKHKK